MKKTLHLLFLSLIIGQTTNLLADTPPSTTNKSVKHIKLYTYPHCRYCVRVKDFLKNNKWEDKVVIINANESNHYNDLIAISGKDYCPYLVDEINDCHMGDSTKIIEYLKKIFTNK
ncbi:glutathione S-transferase N-terminal domain-containing protein [Candidatus Dependentiae bacterium]|nr:glutathione S-transferase N-terminal domain-containing protein [Candidatus Dependentiae bacterium]